MPGWEEEPLGAFGSGSNVPTGEWFPINTDTGQRGSAAPTIASDAGVNWAGIPDLIPTRTMAPSPMMGGVGGAPDQSPLSIGQVAGGFAPQMTTPRSMQRVQRLDEMGALTRQPGMWETIARGIGNLSPQGRQMLQSGDQQQQQQLQNRLTMRRQALQEEQNERAEIRDDFSTLVKLSEVKSKALRNLYTDRWVADMQAKGKALPADFIETFKKTGIDEGKQMAQLMEPLISQSGMDPKLVVQLLEEGRDPKEMLQLMELAEKQKKTRLDEAESASIAQQRQQMFGTGAGTVGDASGTTSLAAPGAPTAPGAPPAPARQPLAAPSTDIRDAIDESTRLYPQVRKDLITSIAASESNFDPKAKSSAGAEGVMQLMPGTAKDMGVDDPYDVKQNVRGGTRYFAQMLTRYKGNEALALAAYNWGPGNVDKVEGNLSKMPEETQSYVKTTLQRASGGGGTAPDTRMQVAGPGAPAPSAGTPQDQAQLTRLDTQIHGMTQYINANLGSGKERTKGFVNELQQERTRLIQERKDLAKKIEEPGDLLRKKTIEQPFELEKAREAKALTPIDRMTQQSLATNKAVYRSIGKIEDYFREGTDLPENFVTLVAEDAPGIRAAMQADPKNATGILQQWETKLQGASKNDPNVNRFLSALGNMRDLIIRERSGGSVTGNELDRAMGAFMGSLPNVNQAFSLFVQNLANVKETVMDELVTAGAAARPLSGGKAMYGTLPKEIRERIDYAERGEDYPKAQMPAASSPTVHTPPTPRKGTLAGPITPSVR